MYFVSWVIVGFTGWSRKTGKGRRSRADREHRNGYRRSSSRWLHRAPRKLTGLSWVGVTVLAVILGAAILTGINAYASARKRYA